jgi:hypothetical protein
MIQEKQQRDYSIRAINCLDLSMPGIVVDFLDTTTPERFGGMT